MADEILSRDQNFVTVLAGVTDDADQEIRMLRVDPITKALLVTGSGGGGGVTSLNGLTGDITLAAGSNITLTPVGITITISASGGGSSSFVDNEIVAGSTNTFTLANMPVLGSEHVYALGQRLYPTTDYTILGAVITTVNAWNTGMILADYRK